MGSDEESFDSLVLLKLSDLQTTVSEINTQSEGRDVRLDRVEKNIDEINHNIEDIKNSPLGQLNNYINRQVLKYTSVLGLLSLLLWTINGVAV